MSQLTEKAKKIELIIFDVDGVLTDGTIYLFKNREEIKGFNTQDGLGFKLLQKYHIHAALITGRTSSAVSLRAKDLGIQYIYQGCHHKISAYEELLKTLQLENNQVAYMGDDLIDLALMHRAGLSFAPANAVDFIQKQADLVTQKSGGHGAAREVCDFILEAKGYLKEIYQSYS